VYFRQDKEPRGIIPLESLSVRECAEEQSRDYCFELFGLNAEIIKACKTDKKTGKVMEGRHQVYKMSAATGEEMADWIKCIKFVSVQISYALTAQNIHMSNRCLHHCIFLELSLIAFIEKCLALFQESHRNIRVTINNGSQ